MNERFPWQIDAVMIAFFLALALLSGCCTVRPAAVGFLEGMGGDPGDVSPEVAERNREGVRRWAGVGRALGAVFKLVAKVVS